MVTQFYSPGNYQRSESLGWLLRRLKQSIVSAADVHLSKHGLTHAQWGPMLTLRLCGTSSVAFLVRELDTDAGAMTRMLDRLEVKGLCQRERSAEDRRVVLVSLTDEGLRITTEVTAVLSDVFNAHLAGFSEDGWGLLVKMLQRMVANGEALQADPAGPEKGE
ncbi:MAG: MarR family transcriptional regulator [Microbacteriaceae bacterium]|nr:MarR family transcriptional regulator [Burkholderiaceae bacterium]